MSCSYSQPGLPLGNFQEINYPSCGTGVLARSLLMAGCEHRNTRNLITADGRRWTRINL
ncbi:hypothetical protein [Scytonema hofmannii]|uniref:hypothetical protein n=1 Tax=Scytonema hofmannii TaxID=34078 RepID=UPI00034B49E4|nr:hypothetical protein [Scytonema hofmannii]